MTEDPLTIAGADDEARAERLTGDGQGVFSHSLRLLPAGLLRAWRIGVDGLGALLPQVAGDLHGAELGAAHGAELRVLEHVVAQRLVVHAAGRFPGHGDLQLAVPVVNVAS